MVAFLFVTQFVEIPKDYMNYVVAVALGILAYMFWKEKTEDLTETQHGHFHSDTEQMEHEHLHWHKETGNHFHIHAHQKIMMRLTLGAIAGFALALGFAHEEEFVILSLAVGGIEPILLMIAYASAVASALIGITILAVKVYTVIEKRILHYIKYLPKISAIMLAFMAVGFALNIF